MTGWLPSAHNPSGVTVQVGRAERRSSLKRRRLMQYNETTQVSQAAATTCLVERRNRQQAGALPVVHGCLFGHPGHHPWRLLV